MAATGANLELSLRNFLKSGPKDDDTVHAYAEKLGVEPHDLEGKIYNIAFKALSGAYFKHADDDDSQFDADQLKRGIEVEKEHTDDEAIAKVIAKAHLSEFPDYYSRLADMEDQAKKSSDNKSMNNEERKMKNFIESKNFPILSGLLMEASSSKILGHTRSGKAILNRPVKHPEHFKDWTPEDHADAFKAHFKNQSKNEITHGAAQNWHRTQAVKKHKVSHDDFDDMVQQASYNKIHAPAKKANDWFASLSDEQKKQYKELHPHSKLV